jgi:hypothetical protein
MTEFHYRLNNYTWEHALLWGNCIEHGKKVGEGNLGDRLVHGLIALIEGIPIIGQIASIFEKVIVENLSSKIIPMLPKLQTPVNTNNLERPSPVLEAKLQAVLDKTPEFNGYTIDLPDGKQTVLTGVSLRPSNLFFEELFKGSLIKTNLPGSHELFRFTCPQRKVREYLYDKLEKEPEGMAAFSAEGKRGQAVVKGTKKTVDIEDLGTVFGNNTYRISYKEIIDTLESQRIYLSPMLPLPFYCGLKIAMKEDGIVTLPGTDREPLLLSELKENIGKFLAKVRLNPESYGFSSKEAFEQLCEMTLYQIGSMVVKSEDFHIFTDGKGKILERQVGQKDAVRLINICGIRGVHSSKTPKDVNKTIMTNSFKTALVAAEDGFMVLPAVGMGVWRGDPNLYWQSFLDALLVSNDKVEKIFVNPGHKASIAGDYEGSTGEEFQKILNGYYAKYKDQPEMLGKLDKIVNLHGLNRDIAQLSLNLKEAYPEKTISIVNASDPDVTLGYHVGEYVNNYPHVPTTEENYTAMGTNGLCFEGITNVLNFMARLISVK